MRHYGGLIIAVEVLWRCVLFPFFTIHFQKGVVVSWGRRFRGGEISEHGVRGEKDI